MQQTPNHFVTGTYSPAHQGALYLPGTFTISLALKSSYRLINGEDWFSLHLDFPNKTKMKSMEGHWIAWWRAVLMHFCSMGAASYLASARFHQHIKILKFLDLDDLWSPNASCTFIQVEPHPDWWFIGGRMRPGGIYICSLHSFNHSPRIQKRESTMYSHFQL